MNGLKTLILTAVFVMGMTLSASADIKIGYMDLSKVFDSYAKTKEYDAILEGKHSEYEKERNTKIEKLKESQNKLSIMKEEEKAKLQEDIEKMREELLAFDQSARTDLTKQRDEKIREILLEIEKTVSDFAKAQNYNAILNDRVLIYGDPSQDVSEQVLTILNQNYNKKP